MIVAVEDLRSVEFTLVLVERRAKGKQSSSKKVFLLPNLKLFCLAESKVPPAIIFIAFTFSN